MRILLAGSWISSLHEQPAQRALEELGHEVHPFGWTKYFGSRESFGGLRTAGSVLDRAQNKYLIGPAMARLNRELVSEAKRLQPDLLFVYRGTHVYGRTLRAVKQAVPRCALVGYNNDDPFSGADRFTWRHFLKALPDYDLVLAYREHNVADYLAHGAKRSRLLRSWFDPRVHRPVEATPEQHAKYDCDVVFIGHFEDDGRIDVLEAIAATGAKLRVFGPGSGIPGSDWNGVLARSKNLRALAPTNVLWGDEYAAALSCAKIALCFLSKRNRDTYTRRVFEIPATGALLLSEYSDDLTTLYEPGVEADFFRSPAEAAEKAAKYLGDEQLRRSVAAAGHARAWQSGYDVKSRMAEVVWSAVACHRSESGGEPPHSQK
jgi:spore maturation protein CgeB